MFLETEDSAASMTRAFGEALKQVSYSLERSKPDLILSGFDIAANAAVTIAGAHMNIPVAHIHGGELTFGAIDDAFRHSITKMSHVHFTANSIYKKRVIQLDELPIIAST